MLPAGMGTQGQPGATRWDVQGQGIARDRGGQAEQGQAGCEMSEGRIKECFCGQGDGRVVSSPGSGTILGTLSPSRSSNISKFSDGI